VNAQELFLDVASGRFLDGDSTIPTNKPSFFSDEQRRIKLAVRKVKNNKLSSVEPSTNARYSMRLGTATQKLADATDVSTAPIVLVTALGSIATSPANQASGLGVVATYSPVTATFEATVSTQTNVTAQFIANFRTTPAITALFKSEIFYVNPVTASVTVAILTVVTQFVATTAVSLSSATFSYISASCFGANIDFFQNPFNFIRSGDTGTNFYTTPQVLRLTAEMNSPIAGVFSCSFSAGSVTTISLISKGQGYPSGIYALTFSGGGATAGTVTATAEVTTTAGKIESISLTAGGSGYASAPTATLFTPAKSLDSIAPTTPIGSVNGKSRFQWVRGVNIGDSAPIRFTEPDTTSIVTNTSVPSAFLVFTGSNIWEINIVNKGYGYVATPTVTHDSAPAASLKFTTGVSGGFSTISSGTVYIDYGGVPINLQNINSRGRDIFTLAGFEEARSIATTVGIFTTVKDNIGRTAQGAIERIDQIDYADKTFFGTVRGTAGRHALIKATCSPISSGYIQQISFPRAGYSITREGGGLFETTFEVVDYGSSYTNILGDSFLSVSNVFPIYPLATGRKIFESPITSVISIPLTSDNKYANTLVSYPPTVATRPGKYSTEYFFETGGFGFTDTAYGTAFSGYRSSVNSQTATAGGLIVSTSAGIVTTASLATYPKAYILGTYDCQVQSPVSGTTAKIQLVVSSATANLVIIDGGSGYTSAPIVTAPTPFAKNGYVTLLSSLNRPSGYTAGISIGLLFTPSVATGGTAQGEFALKTSRYIYASAVPSVAETSYLTYEGVSTDPFNQAGVRNKYDPPIPEGAKITAKTNSKIVAKNTSGSQSISELIVTYLDYRITDSGFGYTVAPAVISEAPSKSTGGEIVNFSLANRPTGYNFGTNYDCSVATSPLDNGTAQLSFSLLKVDRTLIQDGEKTTIVETPDTAGIEFASFRQYDSTELSYSTLPNGFVISSEDKYIGITYNGGFGYTTSPTITAPTPDSRDVGQIIGLKLTNAPVGYRPNNNYQLTIDQSPEADGRATARFSVSSLGVISAQVENAGFGYITKPTITAASPDLDQGLLGGVSVSTLGRGFAPGSYICNVTDAPSGGQTAVVNFNTDDRGVGVFEILSAGRGYVTAPIISVPTPFGNTIKSITISCKGSFYEPQTTLFSINDSTGSGVSLGLPILSSGGIQSIAVIAGGYGYSSTPAIQFSAPTEPIKNPLEASFVEGDFNITVASANAILSTSTQKDILLEVFETDGTNEQVIAQATVSLAKRVLE
jgi:hypothetical protein